MPNLSKHRTLICCCLSVTCISTISQACLPRFNNRLAAAGDLELAENGRDLVAHRLGAEDQFLGDGVVGEALCQQSQNLSFAGGEFREGHGVANAWHAARKKVHHLRSDARAKDHFPIGNSANGAEGFVPLRSLEQIAPRSSAHGRRLK